MKTPLISICLPNLNHRPFLGERMETLLNQTFTDWELIICDSYSEDGAWEFFQQFKGDSRIRMEQVPKEGLYAGWNECLRRATGKYIYIATSDDTAEPELLETLLVPLERRPEIHVSVCDFQDIDADGNALERRERKANRFLGDWMKRPCIRNGKTEFLMHACFGTLWVTMTSVLFRKDLLAKTGLFRTDQLSYADQEWTLRASLASDIAFTPGKLATWRVHDKQHTPLRMDRPQARILYETLKELLGETGAGIPASWTKIPDWNKQILEVRYRSYMQSWDLYRWVAKEDPRRFLSGVLGALKAEPQFLLKQLFKGFRWEEEPEPAIAAEALIKSLETKWPPTEIEKW